MLWVLIRSASMIEYPQCMFSSRNKKNIMRIPLLICSYGYIFLFFYEILLWIFSGREVIPLNTDVFMEKKKKKDNILVQVIVPLSRAVISVLSYVLALNKKNIVADDILKFFLNYFFFQRK